MIKEIAKTFAKPGVLPVFGLIPITAFVFEQNVVALFSLIGVSAIALLGGWYNYMEKEPTQWK